MQDSIEKSDFGTLVRSFPSLRFAPTEPSALEEWLGAAPRDDSAHHAACFCLRRAGVDAQFNLFEAIDSWDRPHLGALFRAYASDAERPARVGHHGRGGRARH